MKLITKMKDEQCSVMYCWQTQNQSVGGEVAVLDMPLWAAVIAELLFYASCCSGMTRRQKV